MTQPKKPARSSSARKPAGATRRTTAKSSTRSASSARSASPRAKASASKPKTTRGTSSRAASAKAPSRAGAKPTARKPAGRRAASKPQPTALPTSPQEVLANLGALRERLVASLTLSPDRLQETVDDTVRRGRMTRRDAEELLTSLVTAGRQQTEALLADMEQLLGLGTTVRRGASRGGDAMLRGVDRARRRVGVPGFPILNYDELTAAQVTKRLGDLTPAELRKVRDYERKHENRKSVLTAIERKLG